MLTTIIFRFPSLPMRFHMVLQAGLWVVLAVLLLALSVAALLAVAPVLPQLAAAAFIIVGYAGLTYPRSRKQVRP